MKLTIALAFAASLAVAQTQPAVKPNAKPAPATAPTAKSTKSYTPPKLPWGDPDLQGQWHAASSIPIQRPHTLAGRSELTNQD